MADIITDLTKTQFNTLYKVMKDVFEFSKFIYVIHPLKGKVQFNLFPFQVKLLYYFLTRRFNIVLKFRQAGVTELIAMYSLWLAMYHPNKTIQIISIKDRVAKKVLRKIKFMYRNLPEYLKVPIRNGRSGELGTVTELEFINGSIITSIPTTEDAGRSEALSLLVIDEAAIVKWANRIWAAAFPTLSTGGSAIVNSTPFGVGNWYHSEWVKACAGNKGQEEFTPIRLRWQMHPERDRGWYDSMKKHLGPRRTAQEIDGDFLTSGNSVFDLLDIREIEEMLTEVDILERKFNGCFNRVYNPTRDVPYFIGADISTGRSRDYSAFSIQSSSGVEHAYFKGKLPVDKLANLLMEEGKKYNYAVIAPETNDVGLAVTALIQNAGYPNLYFSTKMVKEKGERKPKQEKIPGWMTTMKNRPIIINELERDISNGLVEINNPFFVQEAYTFIYDERNRPIALGKGNIKDSDDIGDEETFTDDAILSTSITNFIRKGRSTTIVIAPK